MDDEIRGRVLVVDDIEYWRKLIPNILKGYRVTVIDSYAKASQAIGTLEFDVAILDIRLEDENVWNVDGIDLLRQIRESNQKMAVIILTGHLESARDRVLKDYKPDAIIRKENIDYASLRVTVQNLVAQYRGISDSQST